MTLFTLYLLFVLLPGLHVLFWTVAAIMMVACFIIFCVFVSEHNEHQPGPGKKVLRVLLRYAFPALAVALLGANLLPDERQVYLLAGGYAVANVEGVENLPPAIVKAATKYLDGLNGVGVE
jgi:hypothetical protein